MGRRLSKQDLEERLFALGRFASNPRQPDADREIRAALASQSSLLAGRAAAIIAEHRLPGLHELLSAAFDRFMIDAARSDPGCAAKAAIANALDHTDSEDPAPFLRGVRHFQKPSDCAAPLRARSGMALVRMNLPGALSILADMLADPDRQVRTAAAAAAAFSENPAAIPMLRLKLHLGDAEPEVLSEVLRALIQLAPEEGLELADRLIASREETERHGAVLALGESRQPAALPKLRDFVSHAVTAADKQIGFLAIGLLRTESARELLAAAVARGDEPDARFAAETMEQCGLNPSETREPTV